MSQKLVIEPEDLIEINNNYLKSCRKILKNAKRISKGAKIPECFYVKCANCPFYDDNLKTTIKRCHNVDLFKSAEKLIAANKSKRRK